MRKTHFLWISLLAAIIMIAGCQSESNNKQDNKTSEFSEGSFGYDLDFLTSHKETIVLKNKNAMVALVPDYQGRVMTSSAQGLEGMSFGWLNYELIQSGKNAPHFNNFGGEERFWLGPEGGQFSVFFKPGVSFAFENWQVPAPIDSEPFELVEQTETKAVFAKEFTLQNYSEFVFNVRVDRTVKVLSNLEVSEIIGTPLPSELQCVAYTTENKISNIGNEEWTKQSGLLSIWILGQFISSPTNTVLAPFVPGSEEELGPIVNDTYFGKIPESRLAIQDSVIFFKADGKQRGKIGLSPSRSKNYLGSYDADQKLLTLAFFNKPDSHQGYVNSMWELQEKPFGGDVINSYNDGPLDDGSQLGPFYELETSSPAASLKPGKSLSHNSTTIHISGSDLALDPIVKQLFGIDLNNIKQALGK